ncbi:MAG: ATP-binding cassette domain-containing protein [Planctomycetaceae bacterium]|nr:ATP-binding cassette domain-containing protein [Planctomycetaceae bacterium]
MIEVSQIGKSYPDGVASVFWALKDVSFTVRSSEVVGLVGANGAGKTSLLRILSTVLRPSAGNAWIGGQHVVQDAQQVRRLIGFVSANTAVYDRMTAAEYVRFFGRFYDLPDDELEDRIDELFVRFRMTNLRDQLCGRMSTGMKQKVSIARALIHDPRVLIFDEATLGLDIMAARSVMEMVLALREESKCIIFSTHIMSELERLCDRLVVLHRGRLIAEGTAEELMAEYHEEHLEDMLFQILAADDEATTV